MSLKFNSLTEAVEGITSLINNGPDTGNYNIGIKDGFYIDLQYNFNAQARKVAVTVRPYPCTGFTLNTREQTKIINSPSKKKVNKILYEMMTHCGRYLMNREKYEKNKAQGIINKQ